MSPEPGLVPIPPRWYYGAAWDEIIHLDAATREGMWVAVPPHEREARARGVPTLGAGAIYPVAETEIVCEPFDIPDHWPRVYGLDVGWNRTAAVWGALDRETDTLYLYDEHYRGRAVPSEHAAAVRARGDWVPGVIDPAARGRAQTDGRQLLQAYLDLGLELTPAASAVEAGLHAVWQRLASGRLRVFASCRNWLDEFRLYRRDDDGHIVKQRDHLMDATRYLVLSGLAAARCEPVPGPAGRPRDGPAGNGWLGH